MKKDPSNKLKAAISKLSPDELDLIRQWFDAVQDLNPQYLERLDYLLARKIYEALKMRVPYSITNNC